MHLEIQVLENLKVLSLMRYRTTFNYEVIFYDKSMQLTCVDAYISKVPKQTQH